MTRVFDGVGIVAAEFTSVQHNDIYKFVSNSIFGSGARLADITVQYNLIHGSTYSAGNQGDHQDAAQFAGTPPAANFERIKVNYNLCFVGDGDSLCQGPFFNDIGYRNGGAGPALVGGQNLTTYTCVDCEMKNNFYDMVAGNGFVVDLGTGWVFKNNVAIRGKAANVILRIADSGNPQQFNLPTVSAPRKTESVSGTVHDPQGVHMGNISHNFSGFQAMSSSKNVTLPSPGLPSGSNNEAARVAFYSTYFQNPGNDDVTIAYRPVANGPLLVAPGEYAGPFNPDGSWASVT